MTEVAAQAPEASDDGAAEAFAQAMRVVEALLFASAQPLPAEELAQQPWAGCVLRLRVSVPGLPVNFVR